MGFTNHFDARGKSVIVAGGSKGLGQELALQLVARGADVTVLARSLPSLKETKRLMEQHLLVPGQTVDCQSLDLTDKAAVVEYISSLDEPPWALVCVAGGTAEEIGFLADISPDAISSCMTKNYVSSAYIAQAVLKRWVTPTSEQKSNRVDSRHLVFTASTAALVSVPGYAAYAPTKAAIRSLADILRQEVLMYQSVPPIKVHCSFPGTIYTESFFQEQQAKPHLCKQIEGTLDDKGGMTAKEVARLTLQGLDRGQFFITPDFQTRLLLNNMRGPSPQ
ncbi:steroid dehydrogenase [Pochonia chlamydosporia 170]|uniref:3-dehydrosphinganine reductase n=1 Tax=Pochonia chlamydosporia 170 TaxID=1380566 RepID=A0A179FLA7_METCM|nr:steroid dehydrogenase [Pochonia chlamydosporia 170]OAQ66097.2 steroid dehydrogenase [Pochonia chlamydosporia 170]